MQDTSLFTVSTFLGPRLLSVVFEIVTYIFDRLFDVISGIFEIIVILAGDEGGREEKPNRRA